MSSPPPLVSTSQHATQHNSSVGRLDLGQLEEWPASDTEIEEGEYLICRLLYSVALALTVQADLATGYTEDMT